MKVNHYERTKEHDYFEVDLKINVEEFKQFMELVEALGVKDFSIGGMDGVTSDTEGGPDFSCTDEHVIYFDFKVDRTSGEALRKLSERFEFQGK